MIDLTIIDVNVWEWWQAFQPYILDFVLWFFAVWSAYIGARWVVRSFRRVR